MSRPRQVPKPPLWALIALVATALAIAVAIPATAQNTTATVRGVVTDSAGAGLGAVTVVATNTENGFKHSVVTGNTGNYALNLPPGPYDIVASSPAHEALRKPTRVAVGQDLELNFSLKPGTKVTQDVSVVATATVESAVEMKTSEIATNVSLQQIESLPQPTRNFLNAATLAPGVRITPTTNGNVQMSYGAQGGMNTNVFLDGTTYKSDILNGGMVGQDSSPGNPFPQNAVAEFRVITQNYKAEYQKASSVIVSAITKSGTNEFHGEAFAYYTDKNLEAQDRYSDRAGIEKPKDTRWQPGLSIGGPITKDRFHFFASYEGNYQDHESSVYLGNNSLWPTSVRNQYASYAGNYPGNFSESLFFGKFSAAIGNGGMLDVSGDYRTESNIRDFGNRDSSPQTSYDSARDDSVDVLTGRAKYTALFGNFLNEANVSYQQLKWKQTPRAEGVVGQNFEGLIRIGNNSSAQDISQDRFAIRDDLTLLSLQGAGDHVIKGGVSFDKLQYKVSKWLNGNPVFNYDAATYINTPGDMPYQAQYGVGSPDVSVDNTQWGLYIQDDWRITPYLTANIGLRWDVETDMLDNDYVTPADIRSAFKNIYTSNYFTDGTQRDTYYGAVQPRLGISWDVSCDGTTVVHGGYGKYYDRTLYNDILDEKYRLQYKITTFWFSKDGSPQRGNPAIKWDPSYLSVAGLNGLIASGTAPAPELFLLDNNTKPPSSDQWSLGVRQNFGTFNAGLNYAGVYSKNQMTWTCGIKDAAGNCDWGARPAPGYGFSMLSRGKETWYNSIQATIEKPFTASSKWSGFLSYVWSDAKQTGNDLFSWGQLDPVNGNKQRSNIAQEHTITASAIWQLPAGFRVSTLINLGSGYPFYKTDCSQGYDKCVESIGGGDSPKWTESVDLRLDKYFTLAGSYRVGLSIEVINLFNYVNQQGYDGWIPALPDVNTNYGQPNSAYNPRRVQLGASFSF